MFQAEPQCAQHSMASPSVLAGLSERVQHVRAEQGSERSGLSHNAFGFGKLSAAVGAVIVPLLELQFLEQRSHSEETGHERV